VVYRLGKGKAAHHARGEGKFRIKNHEEGNGKPPRFVFPRHDMDITVGLKDNGVNEAGAN